MTEQKTVEKFDWKAYIERIEKNGYEFLWTGACPNCGSKAAQIHNDGVIHTKCENEDFNETGFGGPNVRSWSAAVAFDSQTEEEKKEARKTAKREIEEKQNRLKTFLLRGET